MSIRGIGAPLAAYQSQAETNATTEANRAKNAEAASARAGRQTAGSGDKVQLSHDGVLRTAALSTAMSASDIRQEKVDSIKDSLSKGTYTIDNRKIAEKLLTEERALFNK